MILISQNDIDITESYFKKINRAVAPKNLRDLVLAPTGFGYRLKIRSLVESNQHFELYRTRYSTRPHSHFKKKLFYRLRFKHEKNKGVRGGVSRRK